MRRLIVYSLLVTAMAVACTKVDVQNQSEGDGSDFLVETRSYDDLRPDEFGVVYEDVESYVIFKATGQGWNFAKEKYDPKDRFFPEPGSCGIACYPGYPEKPSVFIPKRLRGFIAISSMSFSRVIVPLFTSLV